VTKTAAFALVSLRQHLAARGVVVARLAFYATLLLVFSRLWAAVGPRVGLLPVQFLWYLAITELVTLSVPFLSSYIEEDVRRGDVAARLARPVGYLGTRIAEGLGEMAARFLGLVTLGFLVAWLLAGGLPPHPLSILAAVPLAFLSACLHVVVQGAVGLSAFWLHEATPLHWVTQKLLFVFGGLLFPLEIYPDWLRTIAMWTPFAAMVHGPARLVFGFDGALFLSSLLRLLGWGAAIGLFVFWLNRRALRALEVGGG